MDLPRAASPRWQSFVATLPTDGTLTVEAGSADKDVTGLAGYTGRGIIRIFKSSRGGRPLQFGDDIEVSSPEQAVRVKAALEQGLSVIQQYKRNRTPIT
jgi:hypothetical protein